MARPGQVVPRSGHLPYAKQLRRAAQESMCHEHTPYLCLVYIFLKKYIACVLRTYLTLNVAQARPIRIYQRSNSC